MVFEVKNLAVAAERWVGGPQDCSHSQFFFAKRAGLQPQPKFSWPLERGSAGLNH